MRICLSLLTLMPCVAGATGFCEGLEVKHQLTHVAPDGRHIIRTDEETCSEGPEGEDRADEIRYRVRSAAGKTVARFCAKVATGCAALETLPAWTAKNGFTPVSSIEKVRAVDGLFGFEQRGGPACRIRVKTKTRAPERDHATHAVKLSVRLPTGRAKTLASFSTQGEVGHAQLVILPAGLGLLSWTTARCGGPAPGYFGEDDGGECMPDVKHHVRVLTRDTLGPCVQSTPKAPGSKAPGSKAPGSKATKRP